MAMVTLVSAFRPLNISIWRIALALKVVRFYRFILLALEFFELAGLDEHRYWWFKKTRVKNLSPEVLRKIVENAVIRAPMCINSSGDGMVVVVVLPTDMDESQQNLGQFQDETEECEECQNVREQLKQQQQQQKHAEHIN